MAEPMKRFDGAGGVEIAWQSWLPGRTPRATVAIAHGVSEHSDRYEHVAARLTGAGYAVYALDHRGHGDSEGPRAVIDRVRHAVADIDTLIGLARGEQLYRKLFLLGHSMGGALAVEYALAHQDRIDGLVLSAPAADAGAASAFERIAGRVLSVVAPNAGVFEVHADRISRDPEVVREYVEDPRVFHGKLPARTVSELVEVAQSMPKRVPAITVPLLVMVGTGDEIVLPHAARMIAELAGSQDKRLIEYDDLFHEILNEPEQDRVMDDLVAWLDAHT
jgi:alpha-beta hydrolase superfamily lysophospholipase